MGNLLLLNLAGKEGLSLLDTGPDPGLALVGPVGAQPKANLLFGRVSMGGEGVAQSKTDILELK